MSRFNVKKVAVLGAGVMGAQIAAHLVNARVDVILYDLPAKDGDRSAVARKAIEALKKAGMQVTELPPEEVAKLREKMKPVLATHAAAVGQETVDAINAELAKLRK